MAILTFLFVKSLFQKPIQPGPQNISVRNTVAPRKRAYGRCKVESILAELKVSEITDDGILYVASIVGSGQIDAYEEHRINDEIVRVDGTGQVTYPAIWLDTSRVQLDEYLGAPTQTANARLIAAFPGRWTAEHRLDGIAYTMGKFNGVPLEDFAEVYKAGVPTYSAIIRGALIWDPRDPYQDADDPTTWLWSQNAALIIMDYLWNPDGMRLPRERIERALDHWIAQADKCDELIDLIGGGTEARYRLSGEYEFTDEPKKVLEKMGLPIDGRPRMRTDGAIILEIGEFTTPTDAETFGSADILEYLNFHRGVSKTQLANEIRADYTSPGHDFEKQEAQPWRDEASIALDGIQTVSLDLEWCPSHSQARRRMKVESYRQNPEWTGTVITNARGLNLLGVRFARFIIDDLGIDTTFEVLRGDFDVLTGKCTFDVISFPATAYDWEATEEGLSPEFETPGDWGVVVPTDATEVTITAVGGGGGAGGFDGGGGAAQTIKTIAIDPADWGTVILFTVGDKGIGDPENLGNSTDGGDSTVTGTVTAGAIAMFAGGGKSAANGDAGGIASGGDTNTNGQDAPGGNGGESGAGAIENEFPGGGGHEGHDGARGTVRFDWIY